MIRYPQPGVVSLFSVTPKANTLPPGAVWFQIGVRPKGSTIQKKQTLKKSLMEGQVDTLRKNEILKLILNKAWRAQTQREQGSKSRRKLTLKLQGPGGGSEPDRLCAYQPVCSPASELSGSFSGSHS